MAPIYFLHPSDDGETVSLRLASLLVLHRRKAVVGVSVYGPCSYSLRESRLKLVVLREYTLKGLVTVRQAGYDHA